MTLQLLDLDLVTDGLFECPGLEGMEDFTRPRNVTDKRQRQAQDSELYISTCKNLALSICSESVAFTGVNFLACHTCKHYLSI